jgi:uncharacterized protein
MNKEFLKIIQPLLQNQQVLQMNNFQHHKNFTCLQHSIHVSESCYKICKKLHLDYVSASKAALLHDLFLYDWHSSNGIKRHYLHGFFHPKESYKNACCIMKLNDIEKDMILKHMWPLTIKLPKYKETYVICLVDKICCINEVFRKNKYVPYAI